MVEQFQRHHWVLLRVKIIYCFLAALGLVVLAALDWYEGQWLFAICAGSFSFALLCYGTYMVLNRKHWSSTFPEWILVSLLMGFTLLGMAGKEEVVHWVYLVPMYVFFLFSFRRAMIITTFYSLAVLLVMVKQFDFDSRYQIMFTYSSCFVLSVLFALLYYRSHHALHSSVRRDPVTQMYSENQLRIDLYKESTRAERHDSRLLLLAVVLPAAWRAFRPEKYDQHLLLLKQALRQIVRDFDSLYRLDDGWVAVMMPQSEEGDCAMMVDHVTRKVQSFHEEFADIRVLCAEHQLGESVGGWIKRLRGQIHAQ